MKRVVRILIVDDEPFALSALRELLADEGFEVRCAHDGRAACDLLHAFDPDLVLTDIEMPNLNGLELAAHVRATPRPPALVLMSSRERSPDETVPYVRKPISMPELLTAIERSLAARDAGG